MIKIVVETNSVKHQIEIGNEAYLHEVMDAFLVTLKVAGFTYVNRLDWFQKAVEEEDDKDSHFCEEE